MTTIKTFIASVIFTLLAAILFKIEWYSDSLTVLGILLFMLLNFIFSIAYTLIYLNILNVFFKPGLDKCTFVEALNKFLPWILFPLLFISYLLLTPLEIKIDIGYIKTALFNFYFTAYFGLYTFLKSKHISHE